MLHFSEAAVNRTRTFRLSVMLHAGRCASEKKKKKKNDDADQTDAMQPKISDANGGDDVVIRQRTAEPKRRYGPKKPEPKAAASERRQKGSAGDQETQNAKQHKRNVAPKKTSKPQ